MFDHFTNLLNRSAALTAAAIMLAATLSTAHAQNWPDLIPIPTGFEAEGIELGKGHEFFVGSLSFSGNPTHAGSIYKGNLRTGEGELLVEATEKPIVGLSYDARTNYLYGATGHSAGFAGPRWDQGVKVYDASSGDLIKEVIFGDDMVINDVLVTKTGVYCTDSVNAVLYKIPLEASGEIIASPAFEKIDLTGFVMVPGFNANGLAGDFDGKELVVINISTGVLYLVDTASGVASPIDIQGDETVFMNGDGLYMSGRTLYICQNFTEKIAVVQLSGDLSTGTFVKNLVSDDFAVPTTIIGFGNSIYAINTHFFELIAPGGDPTLVETEVVKVKK